MEQLQVIEGTKAIAKTEGPSMVAGIGKAFSRMGLKLKKHSPEILIVAGVVGVVASTVLACKATTKASKVVKSVKGDVEMIHDCMANQTLIEKGEYSEEDGKKDLTMVYTKAGVEMVKLYGPAVALGVVSLGGIIASNRILRKRNIAIAAAYATVDKGFKEYRGRVIERFGETVDKELKYNVKAKKFEETIVNEKGKEKTVTKTVNIADPSEYSEYSRFFDDGCTGWEKSPEYNLVFLKSRQNFANDLLRSRGHLFLNEVYDMLGIPRSKAGQVVGWVYNEENPVGDNFVDFGIYDCNKESARNFVNGYERTILLDFNVDGNVLDLI